MVNRFTYLGSTLSQNVTIDDEINVRIAKPEQPSVTYTQTSVTKEALAYRQR